MLTLSADGRYLILAGYDAPIPSNVLAGTTGATVPRVVGRVDASGTVDTSTGLTDFASGNNPRAAASTDGLDLWVAGGAGGVRYATFGSTTSTQLSTTVTNLRSVQIFNGQLYVSDSSGSAVRLGTVGTGLPTTAGQILTNLPGFPVAGSPYGFFFADLDGASGVDTVYVADDTGTSPGGITKYSLVSGSWVSNGTVGSATDAYRGLTGSVNGDGHPLRDTQGRQRRRRRRGVGRTDRQYRLQRCLQRHTDTPGDGGRKHGVSRRGHGADVWFNHLPDRQPLGQHEQRQRNGTDGRHGNRDRVGSGRWRSDRWCDCERHRHHVRRLHAQQFDHHHSGRCDNRLGHVYCRRRRDRRGD